MLVRGAGDQPRRVRTATTVIKLHGGGQEGIGEDVAYDAVDQAASRPRAAGGLARSGTFAAFCEQVDGLDLFPAGEPERGEVSRLYRRWAYQSAALDLALRQAGPSAARGARARAPAGDASSSPCASASRPTIDAGARAPGPLPDAALQARPDTLVDRRADRRAGRDRRGGLGRLQGPVQGLGRRQTRPTPTSTGGSSRRSPTPGSRTRR